MPIFRFPSRVPYLPKTIYSPPVWRTLYWVGGTADWDTTADSKWSLTSGGIGGEPVPNPNDRVYFDANSGNNIVTITSASTAYNVQCADFPGHLYYAGSMTTTIVDGALSLSLLGLHYLQVVSGAGGAAGGGCVIGSPIVRGG